MNLSYHAYLYSYWRDGNWPWICRVRVFCIYGYYHLTGLFYLDILGDSPIFTMILVLEWYNLDIFLIRRFNPYLSFLFSGNLVITYRCIYRDHFINFSHIIVLW